MFCGSGNRATKHFYDRVPVGFAGWFCWLVLLVGFAGWFCWLVLLVGFAGWFCWLVLLVGFAGCNRGDFGLVRA
ncbi:Uncharacterised protein [Mobiluncus mulieris]|uniref:Uncharacterized protein n=1 Tax=Mobiluncus mulieris TaxID=2052 RepID=A0A8G2M5T4_9ACTO|nr:Uncharacterised protein [Mobiluncus mulieris]